MAIDEGDASADLETGRQARPRGGGGRDLLAVLAVVALTPQLLGSRVADALGAVGDADPRWLWLGGAWFALSVLAAAGSWRSAIGLCGGRIGLADAGARYGAGSLRQHLRPRPRRRRRPLRALLASLGDRERLWRTGGAFAALGAARAVVLAALVLVGAVMGALPLWPVLVLVALVAAAGGVAVGVRRREARSRVAHLLDAFRTLGREPRSALRLVGWLALSVAGRVAAAAPRSARRSASAARSPPPS